MCSVSSQTGYNTDAEKMRNGSQLWSNSWQIEMGVRRSIVMAASVATICFLLSEQRADSDARRPVPLVN